VNLETLQSSELASVNGGGVFASAFGCIGGIVGRAVAAVTPLPEDTCVARGSQIGEAAGQAIDDSFGT
jgi:lactobin A/cerein 7B family class IIb bacteriocin